MLYSLDEAIKHCEQIALEQASCSNAECANEHKQLSEWLKELRVYMEKYDHLKEDELIVMAKKEAEVYGMLFADSSQRCQINRECGFYDGFICGYEKVKSINNGK